MMRMSVCLALMASLLAGISAPGAELPPRPAAHVLDELHGWSATESESLQSVLMAAARDEGLHVYAVLLRSPLTKSARAAAEEYFRAWGAPKACCIVIHAPNLPGGMDAWLGGEALQAVPADQMERALTQIRQRAAGARSAPQAAKSAALAGLGQLRVFMDRLQSTDDPSRGVRADSISINASSPVQAQRWYQALFIAAALFLTALAALWFFHWSRHHRGGPRHFPLVEYRPRFQGLYSGGNDARLDFGARSKKR